MFDVHNIVPACHLSKAGLNYKVNLIYSKGVNK